MYESVTLSHFSQSSVPLKFVKFVVFYWSPLKRNASMLGVRSRVYAAAPCLWNSLPAEVRDIQSLTIFQRNLIPTFFGQVRLKV